MSQFGSVHGRFRSVHGVSLGRFMVGLGQFGSVHGRVGLVHFSLGQFRSVWFSLGQFMVDLDQLG